MARPSVTALILAMMVLAAMPMSVNAEDSGGVQASESTVAITPSNPLEGGSINIRLTLYNSNPFQANDVEYKFYWDGVDSSKRFAMNEVDIPAESSFDIDVTKSGLTVGEHKVWIAFSYGGDVEQVFNKEIMVTGLADLEANLITTSPSSLNSGDDVLISSEISNTGSEDAVQSRIQIDLGSQSEIVNVPSILAGESTWVNHTMTAPESGVHDVLVTVDLDDAVIEADESNTFSTTITVDPRMDLFHLGDLVVDVESGALQGPWVVSGVIARSGGAGLTQVPMKLEIKDDNGADLLLPIFDINISGGENVQQAWSFNLTYGLISTISSGNHQVTAIIDPYNSGSFIQESTDNDRLSGYFDKYDVPDVSVDPYAVPSEKEVTSGSNVDWTVTVTNSGEIPVSGYLLYTWEGQTYEHSKITLQPGELWAWQETLATETGEHIAELDARWVPWTGSFDANFLNSYANGTVNVTAPLKLTWSSTSASLLDSNGESASTPLLAGDEYTIEIKLSSTESGIVNYTCENELGRVFDVIQVEVVSSPQIVTLSCTFEATAPYTNINLVPSDSFVSSTKSWNWESKETSENIADDAGSMSFQTAGMIALICLVLIAVLVAAIILTKEREEEVERDIFDYCPACDGELEGTEDRCPSCSFNLKKARKQFHDCSACGESIPDLLSNCPYCGEAQDISLYFERREKRVVEKETIALVEEEIDPETIHAAGYEGFDEAVKEFGYDSDDLEDHWDDNIAKDEAEVEAAYDRKVAALEENELDDEEALATVTTTLKSIDETFEGHDIDAILDDKDIKAHLDDGGELSASDAEIRSRLFEITGEDGVLPGDEVRIGMGVQDRSLAGNALPEEAMDFSFDEEEDEVNPVAAAAAASKRRRGVRRKSKVKTAECGACGADIPVDANECPTCGAKFE